MRWWKVAIIVAVLCLLPAAAEAHVLSGSGGWVDELVCLVPAAIMVVLVLVLGRDNKTKPIKRNKP